MYTYTPTLMPTALFDMPIKVSELESNAPCPFSLLKNLLIFIVYYNNSKQYIPVNIRLPHVYNSRKLAFLFTIYVIPFICSNFSYYNRQSFNNIKALTTYKNILKL